MGRFIAWLREKSLYLKWAFFCALVAAVVWDTLAERANPHFFGDDLFGFWSVFAFLGCLGMIVVCKGLAHTWLAKEEDYDDA